MSQPASKVVVVRSMESFPETLAFFVDGQLVQKLESWHKVAQEEKPAKVQEVLESLMGIEFTSPVPVKSLWSKVEFSDFPAQEMAQIGSGKLEMSPLKKRATKQLQKQF